ncbi:group III truncated hemoglobin [Halosquirtibacter laminarini]|uniref:Group III truncated hemoglobin n=1 Tax=Halosquirtibacter laminarini TaxID=3374600 RepID=A0AC61NDG5_9BACT|nr:group III truncated hemoglobin [Prolixibacteraceae bacterium]
MKRDIENTQDITLLVETFYRDLCKISEMDNLYNEVIKIDWETHIPIMVRFWGSLVLREGGYRGNILSHHHHVMEKYPLTQEMFHTWENCFLETLNRLFQGPNSDKTKKRVRAMSQSLIKKLDI